MKLVSRVTSDILVPSKEFLLKNNNDPDQAPLDKSINERKTNKMDNKMNTQINGSVELTEEELLNVAGDGLFMDDDESSNGSYRETNLARDFKVLDSTFSQLVFTLSDFQPRSHATRCGAAR